MFTSERDTRAFLHSKEEKSWKLQYFVWKSVKGSGRA